MGRCALAGEDCQPSRSHPLVSYKPENETNPAIASAFSWLAGAGFEVVQPRPRVTIKERHALVIRAPARVVVVKLAKTLQVPSLQIAASDYDTLRVMAAKCGVIEYGGKAMRKRSKYQTGGDVVGRTVWIGMSEWAVGLGLHKDEIVHAVEKAIAGKHLGKRQRLVVENMLDSIAETRQAVTDFQNEQWVLDGEQVTNGEDCPF